MSRHDHHAHPEPLNARTPGGADRPRATDEHLAPLPPAGSTVGTVVAVVDVGIAVDRYGAPHPWFGDHIRFRPDADVDALAVGVGGGPHRLADADGHGTFVSGLVLHEAPHATVVMRAALDKGDPTGSERLGRGDDRRVTEAVRDLVGLPGLAVVNLSFGGGVFEAGVATALEAALRDLDPGVAVVAAAGNDGSSEPVWPAAFKGVIGVGALAATRAGEPPAPARFSNHGWWVDAYADGEEVLGPFVEFDDAGRPEALPPVPPQDFRGWARWSGTSFAAATVAGRIAQTAIERGCTGRQAAHAVLAESPVIDGQGAVRVRSRR